jgi:hypothetical protein
VSNSELATTIANVTARCAQALDCDWKDLLHTGHHSGYPNKIKTGRALKQRCHAVACKLATDASDRVIAGALGMSTNCFTHRRIKGVASAEIKQQALEIVQA